MSSQQRKKYVERLYRAARRVVQKARAKCAKAETDPSLDPEEERLLNSNFIPYFYNQHMEDQSSIPSPTLQDVSNWLTTTGR